MQPCKRLFYEASGGEDDHDQEGKMSAKKEKKVSVVFRGDP